MPHIKTRKKNVFVGGDYSQQEPRLLASCAGDEKMINAYIEGKDLYAMIASSVYHNNYEDNKEFYPDGRMNPDGKARRTACKSLLLGLLYGRGTASIAEQIKTHDGAVTPEDIREAQQITDAFFNGFPDAKRWIDESKENAKKFGFVEDLWGRRRRLPDIQLEPFTIELKSGMDASFNPLIGAKGIVQSNSFEMITKYRNKLNNIKSFKEKEKIKEDALKDGISIKDNGGYISQAERQCVNARIQGGAASMSKRAMSYVYRDDVLNSLNFKLVNAVHDELIGECPEEYAELACKRLAEVMINASKPECVVPMKCDCDKFERWYEDVYSTNLRKEMSKLKEKFNEDEAFEKLCAEHSECFPEELKKFLEN